MANSGANCWGNCGSASGTCAWCGTGKCCRVGWTPAGDCRTNPDEGFISYHGCVCSFNVCPIESYALTSSVSEIEFKSSSCSSTPCRDLEIDLTA